jgi:hypothetical protein
MAEQHIVYAVVDRGPASPIKVRVSEPTGWGEAIDTWEHHDNARFFCADHGITLTAASMPIRFFAVRSANDPGWPADAQLVRVRGAIA